MRILLIEDNESDQRFVSQVLQSYAEELFICSDGEGALKLLSRVDLVILDLNFSFSIGGKELLKKIKKRRKEIPVVIYTTSSNPDDILSCYQNGASCYITKPFGLIETFEKLKQLGEFWKGVNYVQQIFFF